MLKGSIESKLGTGTVSLSWSGDPGQNLALRLLLPWALKGMPSVPLAA